MRWLALAFAALGLASPANSRTWYVTPDGSGDAVTVQAAIDLADSGDSVLVAAGTYSDFESRGGRTSCAFLKPDLSLLSESGPDLTTLDLDGAGGADGVVILGDEVGARLVQGFTIVGAAPGGLGVDCTGYPSPNGFTLRDCILRDYEIQFPDHAAAWIADDRILVVDCLFENCHALTHRASALAVAIAYASTGLLEIRSTTFRDCEGEPAVWTGTTNLFQDVVVADCVFERCSGAERGGGLFLWGPGNKLVEGCIFLDNSARLQGGALLSEMGFPTLIGNTFYGSLVESGDPGAAIGIAMNGVFVLRQNIIAGSAGSAAVWLDHGPADIGCNVFWGNSDGDAAGWVLQPTDRVVDPRFCDPEVGQLGLRSDSPCLAGVGPSGCSHVGALPVECGPLALVGTSWARIKSAYRGD